MVLNLPLATIFIGQNNSGKSNILDAIEFALSDRLSDQSLFYEKADIELMLEFSDDEQIKHQLPDQEGIFVLKQGQRRLIFKQQEIPYNKSLAILLSSKIKRLDEDAFLDFRQIEIDYQNLFKYPANLEKFKEHLRHHFPKIVATANAFDINYQGEGLYEGKRRATIDRLGSGFRRVFTMLLYIFHPSYSVVMINEPEIHLHPAMIDKLLWAMQNSNAGQIIFTTHSPLFITPATLPQVVRVVKEEMSTKAFSMAGSHFDYQRLLQELNSDNLEMFFTDKVVLVEGVSDKLLIRGLIDRFYTGDKDIKVIQTHGKGNIRIYLDLLRIFKIPFAIVMDRDVINTSDLRELIRHLDINLPPLDAKDLIKALKHHNVFILANGDLEANYPRQYQREESKSLNALRAASLITQGEYESKAMFNLKEIIDHL